MDRADAYPKNAILGVVIPIKRASAYLLGAMCPKQVRALRPEAQFVCMNATQSVGAQAEGLLSSRCATGSSHTDRIPLYSANVMAGSHSASFGRKLL